MISFVIDEDKKGAKYNFATDLRPNSWNVVFKFELNHENRFQTTRMFREIPITTIFSKRYMR